MQKDIQELIDQKIETLFSKSPKKKYDPLSQSWLLRNRKESDATLVGVSDWV